MPMRCIRPSRYYTSNNTVLPGVVNIKDATKQHGTYLSNVVHNRRGKAGGARSVRTGGAGRGCREISALATAGLPTPAIIRRDSELRPVG